MSTIGFAMIVKNEAMVIERCLRSVLPLCDHVIVMDTGSSDGTQEVIRAFLGRAGIPGEVIDTPWIDFAVNRTAALEAMRSRSEIDYCLMIDADEQILYDEDFDAAQFKAGLTADWLNVRTRLAGTEYLRPQLLRNALPFRYRGALHEFVEAPLGELTSAIAHGIVNHPTPDGARSLNPRKYLDDADMLTAALATESDPLLRTRYQFYLAQSLRDGGEPERAIEAYRARSLLGGWQDEVFVSLLEIARLRERLGDDEDLVIAAYLRAHDASPARAEALVGAARFGRGRERYGLAYLLARRATELSVPKEGLFVEVAAYAWEAHDEAAVAAYWLGHHEECLIWCNELLASPATPAAHHERIAANRAFALERLDRRDS